MQKLKLQVNIFEEKINIENGQLCIMDLVFHINY